MKKFILLFVALFAFGEDKYYLDDITSKEAYEKQKKGAIIIDVRTPTEFLYTGHGVGHINIPIFYMDVKPKDLKYRINLSRVEIKKSEPRKATKMYKIINIENEDFIKEAKKVIGSDAKQEVILICHQGARSQYAANKLANIGYENVYTASDGFIFGWKGSDLPAGGI